jgi:predicted Zn-dependent peptidase
MSTQAEQSPAVQPPSGEREIQRTILSNGLTIVSERMPHLRSVSVGVWVQAGSRHETAETNGIAHFVEHMVFKGSQTRSAGEIARLADGIGGNLDAYTAKEMICFSIKALDEQLEAAVDILSDLVLRPRFAEEEIVKERGVILEEIKMDADNPESLVSEIFALNFWKDHPLGRPILGTRETVRHLKRHHLQEYHRQHFAPQTMIVSAAGNLVHEELVSLIERMFAGFEAVEPPPEPLVPEPVARIILKNKKALEQVQICLGVPSYPITHPRRYASFTLNTILGGGMSSRLFQNIREKQGLAYAVMSDLSPYKDTGCLAVYAGTSREASRQVVASILDELRRLKQDPVTAGELKRARAQLKSGLMLGLESSSARMATLAQQQMYHQRHFSLGELVDAIESVTAEAVQHCAEELFLPEKIGITMLGNLNGVRLSREQLT